MIALADGYEVNYFTGEPGEGPSYPRQLRDSNPPPRSRVTKRHSGKLNVAFCDGHLEPMTVKQLLFDNDAEWRRKWHRDNEPHSGGSRRNPVPSTRRRSHTVGSNQGSPEGQDLAVLCS